MKGLYSFTLKPATPLHIGSGDFDLFFGAGGIFENGLGKVAIPGSSLAGIFIATLRDVVKDIENDDLFKRITGDDAKTEKTASLLWFRSWYSDNVVKNLRDRLRIEPATRAAADGAKFAQWEIAPHELSIDILIGVENRNLNDDDLEKIGKWVDAVAWSWKEEGVAVGAFSAAGLGWCTLTEAKKFKITKENHEVYCKTRLTELPKSKEAKWDDVLPKVRPTDQKQRYLVYELEVKISNECGIDALLIKGGQHAFSLKKNEVDLTFIHDGRRLFIPGSSVKGAFKAFVRRYNKNLLDFFGIQEKGKECGGFFLIEDLILEGNPSDKAGCLKYLEPVERHAEDELTRAVYGGGKFNEERLFHGTFKGKVRIPVRNNNKWDQVRGLLEQGIANKLISLGAGSSYPAFTLKGMKRTEG